LNPVRNHFKKLAMGWKGRKAESKENIQ